MNPGKGCSSRHTSKYLLWASHKIWVSDRGNTSLTFPWALPQKWTVKFWLYTVILIPNVLYALGYANCALAEDSFIRLSAVKTRKLDALFFRGVVSLSKLQNTLGSSEESVHREEVKALQYFWNHKCCSFQTIGCYQDNRFDNLFCIPSQLAYYYYSYFMHVLGSNHSYTSHVFSWWWSNEELHSVSIRRSPSVNFRTWPYLASWECYAVSYS